MAQPSEVRVRVVATLLAFVFIAVGATKLVQLSAAIELFDALRLPHWSLLVVGTVESVAGVLLLSARTRTWGAMLICVTMTFAAMGHVVMAVEQEGLVLNLIFFAVGLWLVRRSPPRFFAPNWAMDPHRSR
jgi:uncharacterized membrane protein YphA (DoxX/SURF4 family)